MLLEKDKYQTPVLFRKCCGEVTAVFPCEPWSAPWTMACYAHVGQHGGCSREWYNKTRAAKPEEYKLLATELEGLGYRLKAYKRITRQFDTIRENRWRQYAGVIKGEIHA